MSVMYFVVSLLVVLKGKEDIPLEVCGCTVTTHKHFRIFHNSFTLRASSKEFRYYNYELLCNTVGQ
jgi:hypothetical protein